VVETLYRLLERFFCNAIPVFRKFWVVVGGGGDVALSSLLLLLFDTDPEEFRFGFRFLPPFFFLDLREPLLLSLDDDAKDGEDCGRCTSTISITSWDWLVTDSTTITPEFCRWLYCCGIGNECSSSCPCCCRRRGLGDIDFFVRDPDGRRVAITSSVSMLESVAVLAELL